jgi:hypothetical protein
MKIFAATLIALVLAAPAAAATAPAVATAPASGVNTTSARLNGSVDPNGQATSWWFEYGTSTGYGLKTPTHNAGRGARAVDVSTDVSRLSVGTGYHFRLVASNATGTSYGGDQSFTTFGQPGVQTNAPQSIAATSAVLSGSIDPRGRATSWYFDYGPNTAYGLKTPTQSLGAVFGAQPISVTISNLSPATTYHFRLVASNSAGTTRDGDMSLSTPATLTIAQGAFRVIAGQYVKLSGTVSGGSTGVAVTVNSQPFGESALTPLTTVYSGAGGSWAYLARPLITTTYSASASGGTSSQLTIGVQPAVSLRLVTGGRFATHVLGAGPFTGKLVQLQKRIYDQWVTIKRERLDSSSFAFFPMSLLPRGRSTIRIALSVNQAGPGYLAGFSRTLSFLRR